MCGLSPGKGQHSVAKRFELAHNTTCAFRAIHALIPSDKIVRNEDHDTSEPTLLPFAQVNRDYLKQATEMEWWDE